MTEMNAEPLVSAETPAPVVENTVAAPVERKFSQSELNEIVGREKVAARERERQRVEAMYEAKQPVQAPAPSQSMGGMPVFDEQRYRQIAAEEAARVQKTQHDTSQANAFVADFFNKIDAAEQHYPGLTADIVKLNLGSVPDIVFMANRLDNTADVMAEFKNQPAKMMHINALHALNPALAEEEMNKLAQSIKANKAAMSANTARAPLSQMKASPLGADAGLSSYDATKHESYLMG